MLRHCEDSTEENLLPALYTCTSQIVWQAGKQSPYFENRIRTSTSLRRFDEGESEAISRCWKQNPNKQIFSIFDQWNVEAVFIL